MIIARGKSEDKDLIILGLSDANIAKLQAGQPVALTTESEGHIAKALADAGVLTDKTPILTHPGL